MIFFPSEAKQWNYQTTSSFKKKREWLFYVITKRKRKIYHTTVSRTPSSRHQGALLPQLCSLSIESSPPTKTRQFTYMTYLLEFVIRNIACFIWFWCNNTNSQLEWKLFHINVKNLVNFVKLICGPYSLLGSKLLMWQVNYIRLSSPSWLMTIGIHLSIEYNKEISVSILLNGYWANLEAQFRVDIPIILSRLARYMQGQTVLMCLHCETSIEKLND